MSAGEDPVAAVPELEPLYAGELDGALFEDYLADLEELTDVQQILVKEGPEAHADGAPLSLDQARMLLLTGSVRGVQLRYRHEGVEWIDTLVRGPETIRLLRIEAPRGRSPQGSEPVPKKRLRVLG